MVGNELQSISYLLIEQVITPQVSFSQTTTQILSTLVDAYLTGSNQTGMKGWNEASEYT